MLSLLFSGKPRPLGELGELASASRFTTESKVLIVPDPSQCRAQPAGPRQSAAPWSPLSHGPPAAVGVSKVFAASRQPRAARSGARALRADLGTVPRQAPACRSVHIRSA